MVYPFLYGANPMAGLTGARLSLLAAKATFDAKKELTIKERIRYSDILVEIDRLTRLLNEQRQHPPSDSFGR